MPNKSSPQVRDMTQLTNRLDLVNRYSHAVGIGYGPVTAIQEKFLAGEMDADEMQSYVRLCERMIATMGAPEGG